MTTYTLSDTNLVLGNPLRQYVLRVRDLPEEDRPRERLLKHGPAALSIQELLAVVLMTGTKSEEVLAMARRIMTEYGERNILTATDAAALAEGLGIPEGKALQIVACGELGRRFFKGSRDGAPVIRTARDVFEHVTDMRKLQKEHLRGLYLNGHYQLIHDETISIGTVDSNIIHPREVFRPAIAYGAAGVVLVHNHPSGQTKPSGADRTVTEQVAEAGRLLGIDLVDHVIVTEDSFASVLAPEER
ncbi:MAG TPA: DNA repair protein RadC [Candidatus Paceibacterota bacterium]|jgi:DNA repair protein RadC